MPEVAFSSLRTDRLEDTDAVHQWRCGCCDEKNLCFSLGGRWTANVVELLWNGSRVDSPVFSRFLTQDLPLNLQENPRILSLLL